MKIKKITSIFLSVFGLFLAANTQAAQVAEVIVPQADVFLYPQATSKVISKVKKGDSLKVSNLPTEGFYKVRLPNGEMGWVSGNDILSGGGGRASVPDVTPAPRARRKLPQRKVQPGDEESSTSPSDPESFRFQLGYGMQFLSYGGLKDNYDKTEGLNPGKHFGIEMQFIMSESVFWGLRVEVASASASSAIDSDTSQDVTIKEIPVQIGIMWSPVSSRAFRLGFGGYIGATPYASAVITQTTTSSAQIKSVEYKTLEFVGSAVVQMSVGLADAIAIFVEGDYRYDQTGQNLDTVVIKTVPGFKTDYSGVYVRGGLEFRL